MQPWKKRVVPRWVVTDNCYTTAGEMSRQE